MLMRALVYTTVIFVLAVPGSARTKISKETLEAEGGPRTYYLYVPKDLPAEAIPLLLTFHGSGHNGLSLVEKWTKLADREGFIVAGLDAINPQSWGVPKDGPGDVKTLVEDLEARHAIDPQKVLLFGHSAGAVFALRMALLQSEYFAAVAVHAGSFRQADEFGIIDFARRPIPIKLIVGDKDRFFSVDSVNATAEALATYGIEVDVEVVPRHDHWYYDRAKKFNESAWMFLANYRLPGPPEFVEYTFD